MAKYNSQLANEDRMLASKASRELLEKRQKLLTEFNIWKNAIIKLYNKDEEERFRLRGMCDGVHSKQAIVIFLSLEDYYLDGNVKFLIFNEVIKKILKIDQLR